MQYSNFAYRDEFLHTNKLGAYASQTIHFGNTRKYHGILNASIGTLERINVVNRIIESIKINDKEIAFSREMFDSEIVPIESLVNFSQDPIPTFVYEFEGIKITKEILLCEQKNTVYVNYTIISPTDFELVLKPLINFRNIHELSRNNSYPFQTAEVNYKYLDIKLTTPHNLRIDYTGGEFMTHRDIYYNFYYQEEESRGYDFHENLFLPGIFTYKSTSGKSTFCLVFSLNTISEPPESFEYIRSNFIENHNLFLTNANPRRIQSSLDLQIESLKTKLLNNAYLHITQENSHNGIVAGYPWFDEWSRDTFISIHGLLFTTNNLEIAKNIFLSWGKFLHLGLLPNRLLFPKYLNSLDSVLWYVVRLYEYTEISNDWETVEKLLPEIEKVYFAFEDGKNGVKISSNSMLWDENSLEAMTWMDAKVNQIPVVNRSGHAVEIQGLWYNFVRILILFKEKLNDKTHLHNLKKLKVNLEKNFEDIFWNTPNHCLFDVVNFIDKDTSIRPNQAMVLALPFNILKTNKSKKILKTVERYLLTSVGMRTLNKADPKYKKTYGGNQDKRDAAYHQGIIWPFLLGFYIKAKIKVNKSKSKEDLVLLLKKFEKEMQDKSLRYIPEIFSEDEPNGCVSQAWSIATLLEAIYELKKY